MILSLLKLQPATYEQMSVQGSVQRITSNQLIKGANDQILLESKRGFGDAEINIYNGNKAMLAANDQQQSRMFRTYCRIYLM